MNRPRNMTKNEMIAGLKSGRSLMLDRLDAPEFNDLLELQALGLVTSELIEFNDQSSALRWRWVNHDKTDERLGGGRDTRKRTGR